MEQWLRRNQTIIPWALLGADLSIRLGLHLYKNYNGRFKDEGVVDGPTKLLIPKLSAAENAELPYPPDAFPGARDVLSPYGSLRVYEWGPEDGPKVLLVHGITNPCVALGGVAHGLADKGCRVMMFDLPGRGYSSTSVNTPQSTRYFTTCILLALTSSTISWTGGGKDFALIGYSLGGGIAANFTSHFPSLVSSLVLLAPAGLVRTGHINFTNKLIYDYGLLGESWLESIVTKRLKGGAPPIKPRISQSQTPGASEVASSEIPKSSEAPPVLSKSRPAISVPKVVPWQLEANPGFVKAYISSLRYGPISNQHEDWRRIGQRLKDDKSALSNGKVLIIAGKNDVLIIPNELREDAVTVLGESNLSFQQVDAGHDLPVTRSMEIVDIMCEFWQQ